MRRDSELERLFLTGRISEPERGAGERFRSLRAAYGRALVTPQVPRPALVGMVRPGLETRRERVLAAWDRCMAALDGASPGSVRARRLALLEAVVVRNEPTPRLDLLAAALAPLVRLWRLDPDEEADLVDVERGEDRTCSHEERAVQVDCRA